MDTICVPVHDEKLRSQTISKTRSIYENAHRVLILDAWIEKHLNWRLSDIAEIVMRLYLCTWQHHLWTLQAGILAHNIYVILERLGFTEMPQNEDTWPQVWWVPVGRVSLFPIHAAGYYSVAGQNALDRLYSHGQSTGPCLEPVKRLSQTTLQTALLVSMPTTPNQSDLRYRRRRSQNHT